MTVFRLHVHDRSDNVPEHLFHSRHGNGPAAEPDRHSKRGEAEARKSIADPFLSREKGSERKIEIGIFPHKILEITCPYGIIAAKRYFVPVA